jgi:hypothetical protein
MRAWFNNLGQSEKDRREEFSKRFRPDFDSFQSLDVVKARDASDHRLGYPMVAVKLRGFWGKIYEGSPVNRIPTYETREMDDPKYAFLATPMPIQPWRGEFTFDKNKPLFPALRECLDRANQLIADGHKIADDVHGSSHLTQPPT